MKFRVNGFGIQIFILGITLWGMWLTSCNVLTGESRTYMQILRDTAWNAFDSLEISWQDPTTNNKGVLFQGRPEKLNEINKLPADGYQGQIVSIYYRGYFKDSLVSEVVQTFNPSKPTVVIFDTLKTKATDSFPTISDLGSKPSIASINPLVISIYDSALITTTITLDSGNLFAYAFDFDGDGITDDSGSVVGLQDYIQAGFRYLLANSYKANLRVYTTRGSYSEAQFLVEVMQDEPRADAGPNQTVYTGETVHLSGYGYDSLGRIERMEWKIGNAEFAETSGRLSFVVPSEVSELSAILRVTDDDSQSVTDTVIIHVVSRSQANLTDLRLSSGVLSPRFHPYDTVYRDSVPYAIARLSVTPYGNGTLTVNSDTVTSGSPSPAYNLKEGENTIRITVQLDSLSVRTYLLHVLRLPASGINSLQSISISAGRLSPDFNEHDLSYSAIVDNSVTSLTITPKLTDSTARMNVNGIDIDSNQSSVSVALKPGSNVIEVIVTAESGKTKVYTLNIKRKVIPWVSAGDSHSLFIKDDGSVLVAGYNYYGQLGDSTSSEKLIPTQILKSFFFIQAAGGFAHSLFLNADSTIWATGYNYNGQLGDGTNTPKFSPVQVMKNAAYTQLAASGHSLMLRQDGTVWAVGSNFAGQLGDGTTINRTTPVQILPGSFFTHIAAGDGHTLLLKNDGTLWGVGLNRYGQLGDGTDTTRLTPVHVMKGSTFKQIAAGGDNSFMIRSDGTLWATGYNLFGQLGDGTDTTRLSPIQVMPGSTFTQVATGGRHGLMVRSDGTLWATGAYIPDISTDTDSNQIFTPKLVMSGSDIAQIAAGRFHSLILKSDGTVWALGGNTHGQLGDGTKINRDIPVQVLP